jgi:hypothetical protein
LSQKALGLGYVHISVIRHSLCNLIRGNLDTKYEH